MGKPNHGRKPSAPVPQTSTRRTCCSMVAAGHAARRGKFRLATRYARLSLRLIAARLA